MNHPVLRACLLVALGVSTGCEVSIEQPPVAGTNATQEAGQMELVPVQPRTAAPAPVARGKLQFVEGYAQGRVLASRQSKPMMLFFTAGWCGYCRQMASEAFTHPQVVRLSGQFVCVLVDADAEPEICRRFEVRGYPTIQFLSPRGVPLNRVVGKQPGHQVMMAMQAALQHVARKIDAPETRLR